MARTLRVFFFLFAASAHSSISAEIRQQVEGAPCQTFTTGTLYPNRDYDHSNAPIRASFQRTRMVPGSPAFSEDRNAEDRAQACHFSMSGKGSPATRSRKTSLLARHGVACVLTTEHFCTPGIGGLERETATNPSSRSTTDSMLRNLLSQARDTGSPSPPAHSQFS